MRSGSAVFFIIALLLNQRTARARELYGPEAGVTPYGMGRAYSAVADDWLALQYNPAGLALVKKVDFQLFDLKVSSNHDVVDSYKSVKDLGKTSQSSVADTLSKLAGRHIMAESGNNTQLTLPHFAMGVSYDVHTDFDMENLAYPQTQMRYTKDLAFLAGGAVSAGSHQQLRLGVTLKIINRTGGIQDVQLSDISGNKSAITDKFSASGTGIAGDFGTQFRLPIPGTTEVTTSFVWHDMGKTTFGTAQQQNAPTRIEDNIVAGLGVRFPIGGGQNRRLLRRYGPTRSASSLSFAFDYSQINLPWGQEPIAKHTHLGMNLDLPLFSLQLGLNQTAITFGTSVDIGIIRVAFATYGEELGSYAGQKVDRRYLLSIGSVLGFGGF